MLKHAKQDRQLCLQHAAVYSYVSRRFALWNARGLTQHTPALGTGRPKNGGPGVALQLAFMTRVNLQYAAIFRELLGVAGLHIRTKVNWC